MEKEEADLVRAYVKESETGAIYLLEDSKRYYPFGNFAAHVLGFVGTDGNGLDGIEAMYDDTLMGTPGRVVSARNPQGGEMNSQFEQYHAPQNGDGVVLTIDEVVQHFLEKHLETARVDNLVAVSYTHLCPALKPDRRPIE